MRHGQSVANAEKKVAGSTDSPLSPLGEQQVRLAAGTARSFFAFDLLVSSPMRRALDSARLLQQELYLPDSQLITLEDLRERSLGALEGVPYANAPQHNGNYEDAELAPGIEPLELLYLRAKRALDWCSTRQEKHILIIAHNGIGRMLYVAQQQRKAQAIYDQPRLENAVIYSLGAAHQANDMNAGPLGS